tara:strand:+ start:2802 stop:3131 length:330 start_codon:yes stop_codon:yes gene_type:complete
MKQFILYSILLGMVLINAPKSFLHDCTKEVHCSNVSCCDHDHEENDLSIDIADCDLCTYTFHSVDTPNLPVVLLSANTNYAPFALQPFSVSFGTTHYLQLRGPPAIVTI